MKTLDSAKTALVRLPDGRLRASIEHETLRGVTPEMLVWWFEHIDGTTTWNGEGFDGPSVPVYRMWHPYDHIRVRWVRKVRRADGHLDAGSVIAIRETLGGVYEVDGRATVTRFDREAFDFELRLGGVLPVATLLHHYAPVLGGCSFYTELTVGSTLPIVGAPLRALVERFRISEPMLRAWLIHNVEESGETEKFVPPLYTRALSGENHDQGP